MKVLSMTGFGRAQRRLSEAWSASIVVRSVNHKGLDIQVRHNLREELPELENAVRAVLSEHVRRGRVIAHLAFEPGAAAPPAAWLDQRMVRALVEQLSTLDTAGSGMTPPSLGHLLSLPGVIVSASVGESLLGDAELAELRALTADAVYALTDGREVEGKHLALQIRMELDRIDAIVGWLESRQDDIRLQLVERMRERLTVLVGPDLIPGDDRLLQEAAILADRADVAEELVRLRSHIGQFRERLEKGGTVGKALDFLCQELNREVNTVASKCREVGLTERIVDGKTAIERIREQVQNLE